ncbi:acetoacetate--CoA ligase [Sporosarcina sp. FSL K6-1522]|uniref:acetoacetate--CoA ligase n=1 Tax=Sporosarcina sp. FSL K6-1522 TaxID=2921554 RepID=UPI003159D4AC
MNLFEKENSTEVIKEGTFLWEANQSYKDNANITKYMKWLADNNKPSFANYQALWQWSVDELEDFWETIWDYFEIESSTPYTSVLEIKSMPGAKWFIGAKVNYTQHILRNSSPDKVAIYSESETRPSLEITWAELTRDVLILATELRRMGVQSGDRVGAYMPNTHEAVIALLATVSIGAVWSSCSPDFGTKSVVDRFEQIQPKVLIAVDGYTYGGKKFDRRNEVKALSKKLSTVEQVIYVPYLFDENEGTPIEGAVMWKDVMNQPAIELVDFVFEDVSFEHPLWILYSSGTTGIPKGIVHSHGGIVLEMYKVHNFHLNLKEEGSLFFYTTTGWVMFNLLVSGLITKSSIVLYDGNPVYPDAGRLWQIAEKTGTTMFGSSPSFVQIMNKVGISPKESYDLSKLEGIILSGSPAGPEVFEWMYTHVKKDLWLTSQSGGTDIASGFVGAIPIESVHAGEMQVRTLGVEVQAFDDAGQAVMDEVGELVVTKPMPSMPIYFWGDVDNKRYLDSYFDMYPGIWRHGDFIKITSKGSCIIYGRSDSTLNRFGVRMGTSEIYSSVETVEDIKDSLVVNLDLPDGKFFMPLFIVLKEGIQLDDALKNKIVEKIRVECSPRHVPDDIVQVDEIPYTLTNKKMEVPVRRLLMSVDEKSVANRDAMANPSSLDFFQNYRDQVVAKK